MKLLILKESFASCKTHNYGKLQIGLPRITFIQLRMGSGYEKQDQKEEAKRLNPQNQTQLPYPNSATDYL